MRILLLLLCGLLPAFGAKTLEIYFVDVEGGQATLIVSPSGESLLIDTGWSGMSGRDANRIVAAAQKAKIKRIDYLLVTHYHEDHVGGVRAIATLMPVGTFFDHGQTVETGKDATRLAASYNATIAGHKHVVLKPGDTIPLKGVDVKVITSDGSRIEAPLAGAGQRNPFCQSIRRDDDPTENARSVGVLLTFGKFRFVDLGDLTWNKEIDLMCPNNSIGTVDVYLSTHHGMNMSGPPAIVHALHPRVAIMNNGARKGGSVEAWQTIRTSPGLEDLWQLHFAIDAGKEHNVPDTFIANVDEQCEGKYLKLTVEPAGGFSVFNSRNNYTKAYPTK